MVQVRSLEKPVWQIGDRGFHYSKGAHFVWFYASSSCDCEISWVHHLEILAERLPQEDVVERRHVISIFRILGIYYDPFSQFGDGGLELVIEVVFVKFDLS